MGGSGDRQDRLLRAAISAFCSIPRPSRREIAQIEDLAMPLLDAATPDTRRFVAAALSECRHPPVDLVRRLTREPVAVSAPLLVRSEALSDADLISLIARQGLPHARAIAKRPKLSPKVAALIEKLAKDGEQPISQEIASRPEERRTGIGVDEETPPAPGAAAEEVRRRLREMVREYDERLRHRPHQPQPEAAGGTYQRLEAMALTGTSAFFQTALADALGISFARARSLTEAQGYTDLMVALRALDLDEARAFLLVSAVFPSSFNHTEAIRLFLERYRLLNRDAAIGQVRYWAAADATSDGNASGIAARPELPPLPNRRVMRP
jgi:uncharacterized protein (DUF2336 family)